MHILQFVFLLRSSIGGCALRSRLPQLLVAELPSTQYWTSSRSAAFKVTICAKIKPINASQPSHGLYQPISHDWVDVQEGGRRSATVSSARKETKNHFRGRPVRQKASRRARAHVNRWQYKQTAHRRGDIDREGEASPGLLGCQAYVARTDQPHASH